MTDRERLIEILRKPIFPHELADPTEAVADYLLDNGVTVQKWNSADNPPENWKGEGGYLTSYYIYTTEFGTDIGSYMQPANKWLCMGTPCNVTHWMPLPKAPKGE